MKLALLVVTTFVFALIGGLAPVLLRQRINANTARRLAGIAGGLLIGSALLVVVPEGLHLAEVATDDPSSFFANREIALTSVILVGFLLMLFLEGIGIGHDVHEEHHQHEDGHGHGHVHHPQSLALLPIGLTIHAAADGLAIGAAGSASSAAAATLIMLAVIAHKMPAAFSLGVFLSHHHESPKRVARDVVIFALATPVMIVFSYWFVDGSATLSALALLFSAGTFLYVATVDTLPMVHDPNTGRSAALYLGLGALLLLAMLVGFELSGWDIDPH